MHPGKIRHPRLLRLVVVSCDVGPTRNHDGRSTNAIFSSTPRKKKWTTRNEKGETRKEKRGNLSLSSVPSNH
jgi:hypothetical protein